jgi:phospholipid/cholesterol/gamma-HCH transport system permease protein
MVDFSLKAIEPPTIEAATGRENGSVTLRGSWNLRGLCSASPDWCEKLTACARHVSAEWDLRNIGALDSAGSFILWQAWGARLPKRIQLRAEHEALFSRWEQRPVPKLQPAPRRFRPFFIPLHRALAAFLEHVLELVALLGQFILDLGYLMRRPRDIPWRELSATIHKTGSQALVITALVGFLVGIVFSYLSALQLREFGAQSYTVNILGLSIIRELGPMLAVTLVAGRSGSAITAGIGVMRVTEELDALAALGVSHSLRLVLPKVLALMIVLPLLIMWTDMAALIGGASSAMLMLDIGYHQFFLELPNAVPVVNFTIGLGKGSVFGLCIALIACHFGFRIEPNTESLGRETTRSVVTSITTVILADALFGIVFRNMGMP